MCKSKLIKFVTQAQLTSTDNNNGFSPHKHKLSKSCYLVLKGLAYQQKINCFSYLTIKTPNISTFLIVNLIIVAVGHTNPAIHRGLWTLITVCLYRPIQIDMPINIDMT